MDPVSDILRTVRLTGGVFLDARFAAPWCVSSVLTAEDFRPPLPDGAHIVAYHVIVDGPVLLSVGEGPSAEVRAGEIVLLPRNDPHVLASAPGLTPVGAQELIRPAPDGGLATIRHGDGSAAHLVCGFLCSEAVVSPLFASLPPALTLDVREAASRDWIESSVAFAARELAAGRPSTSDLMSRLSELLLVEAIRRYAATLDGRATGWLKGLGDPQVGRALALMHGDIAAPWTVGRLARDVAMSRSAFVERFGGLVGVPPIRYLAQWRIETAKRRLRDAGQSVARIAHAVGYESEEAFSRAFKRETGVSPAAWRDRRDAR